MSQSVIEIKNLSKKYRIDHYGKNKQNTIWDAISNTIKNPASLFTGDRAEHEAFWALKGVNLTINKGDVVGIVGRNGSGKSTMLKILSQIVEPTTGVVKMNGRVASLLEVGTGFHPELTGRENIYFNGSILGMSRKEINSKFNDIVEFSEIEQFLDTPVKFYSSGMYVKLAFSVAAHLDPDILIVDEVLAVGDAAFQKKSLGKMQDVAGQGRTVIFVSHNMASINQLCNRAILLEKGVVKAVGTTQDVAHVYMTGNKNDSFPLQLRIDKSKKAFFTKIDLQNMTGKSLQHLELDQPWQMVLSYNVQDMCPNSLVSLQLTSDEGNLLFMSTDTDMSSEIKTLEPGKYSATIPFDNLNLMPGNYNLHVAIQSPGNRLYDEYENIRLQVIDTHKDIRGQLFSGKYIGSISNKLTWVIDRK